MLGILSFYYLYWSAFVSLLCGLKLSGDCVWAELCAYCKIVIRGEFDVRCQGVCGKVYNVNTKCSGLDKYFSYVIELCNILRYMCPDCVTYMQKVYLVLKEIYTKG